MAKIRNKNRLRFQTYNLLPRVTCLRNVESLMIYAGINPKERRSRAMEALERVRLTDSCHRPSEISGGALR